MVHSVQARVGDNHTRNLSNTHDRLMWFTSEQVWVTVLGLYPGHSHATVRWRLETQDLQGRIPVGGTLGLT